MTHLTALHTLHLRSLRRLSPCVAAKPESWDGEALLQVGSSDMGIFHFRSLNALFPPHARYLKRCLNPPPATWEPTAGPRETVETGIGVWLCVRVCEVLAGELQASRDVLASLVVTCRASLRDAPNRSTQWHTRQVRHDLLRLQPARSTALVWEGLESWVAFRVLPTLVVSHRPSAATLAPAESCSLHIPHSCSTLAQLFFA
jgi:hypothetical protein